MKLDNFTRHWPTRKLSFCRHDVTYVCARTTKCIKQQQQLLHSTSYDLLDMNCFINTPIMRPSSIEPVINETTQAFAHTMIATRPQHTRPPLINGHRRHFFGCRKNIISHSQTRIFLIFTLVILLVLEFASYLSILSRNTQHQSNNLLSTILNNNYESNLPPFILAEALKLSSNLDKYHHDRYHHNHNHQHPRYHFEKELSSNNNKFIDEDDGNSSKVDHEILSNSPASTFYDQDDLASEINNINNDLEKSDDTSPVVVISGMNSYVSASPISIENNYNHKHQYTQHHVRPTKFVESPPEDSTIDNKIFEDINNSTESYHIGNDRHSFAPQQNKRSNVHDELMEKSMRISQNDEVSKAGNLPAEMFITSPFGAGSNSLRAMFSMNPATIIRTRESLALGAIFLNHTYVADFNSCLNDCWQSQTCDTAIYQETPAPSSNPNKHADGYTKDEYVCYQFSCFKEGKLICKFSSHNYYVSSFLKPLRLDPKDGSPTQKETLEISIDGHRVDQSVQSKSGLSTQEMELHQLRKPSATIDQQQKKQDISDNEFISSSIKAKSNFSRGQDQNEKAVKKTISHKLESGELPPSITPSSQYSPENRDSSHGGCHKYQFKCHSNDECIAIYNKCDGINQCLDGSDEKHCPISTTELTLIANTAHTSHQQTHWNKAWDTNKNVNFPELGATIHPMTELKEQRFDNSFKQNRLNYLPSILEEPGQDFQLRPSSQFDDLTFDDQLYPSIDSNLGIEGFFDKDSGRFITYNDASNSLYSLDNSGLLFSPGEKYKHGSMNDLTLTPEKSNKKLDSLSNSFRYKPSSSVDSLQEPHKTFLVPNSYNQVDQSDKLIDMKGWRHLEGKNDRVNTKVHNFQEQSSKQHELKQLDKNPVNSDITFGGSVRAVANEAQIHLSVFKSNNEQKKDEEDIQKLHDSSKPDTSTVKGVTYPDGQPTVYTHIKDGRFHASNKQDYWRDTHIASITIGQEEYDDFNARGTRSALIAFMFGIAITGMLIVIVGLKMKSIRKKLVRRGRRRSLVHEADFLINGMHL